MYILWEGEGNGNYRNATIPVSIPGSTPGNFGKLHPWLVWLLFRQWVQQKNVFKSKTEARLPGGQCWQILEGEKNTRNRAGGCRPQGHANEFSIDLRFKMNIKRWRLVFSVLCWLSLIKPWETYLTHKKSQYPPLPTFVCLFVCWNKTQKTILRLLCWEGSKPPEIWSKETFPPGGVFYLLCSLIKSRV